MQNNHVQHKCFRRFGGVIDAAWYALVGILASNQRFAVGLNRSSSFVDCAFGLLLLLSVRFY